MIMSLAIAGLLAASTAAFLLSTTKKTAKCLANTTKEIFALTCSLSSSEVTRTKSSRFRQTSRKFESS